jgi:hypothetical protein
VPLQPGLEAAVDRCFRARDSRARLRAIPEQHVRLSLEQPGADLLGVLPGRVGAGACRENEDGRRGEDRRDGRQT